MRFPDENHEMSRSGKPRHRLGAFAIFSTGLPNIIAFS